MKRLICCVMCALLCFELNIPNITIRDEGMCFSSITYLAQYVSVLAQCVLPSPVTVLAKEESGSNSLGFIIGDYDVKEKEKEKKERIG